MDSVEHAENKLSKEEIHSALERLRHRKKKFEGLYSMLKEENEILTVTTDSRLIHQSSDQNSIFPHDMDDESLVLDMVKSDQEIMQKAIQNAVQKRV